MTESATKTIRFPKQTLQEMEIDGINTVKMREWIIEKWADWKVKQASKRADIIRATTKGKNYNLAKKVIESRKNH